MTTARWRGKATIHVPRVRCVLATTTPQALVLFEQVATRQNWRTEGAVPTDSAFRVVVIAERHGGCFTCAISATALTLLCGAASPATVTCDRRRTGAARSGSASRGVMTALARIG